MAKRLLKEFDPFASPSTVPTYRPPLGRQALSWQQIVAIVAGLVASLFAVWAFAPGADLDRVRGMARIAFAASAAACVVFTTWHIRSTHRRDLQPDILAQTVPIDSILELGKCHLYFASRTFAQAVEISGYVQNQADAPGMLGLNFRHASPSGPAAIPIPPLIVQVPAAALVSIRGLFPCAGPQTPTQYKVFLDGNFTGGGKRVRFGRRRAFTRKVSSGTTASLVFAGVIFTGGGVSLTFTVSGGPPRRRSRGATRVALGDRMGSQRTGVKRLLTLPKTRNAVVSHRTPTVLSAIDGRSPCKTPRLKIMYRVRF